MTPEYVNSASTIPYDVVMSATIDWSNGTTQPLFTGMTASNMDRDTGFQLGN